MGFFVILFNCFPNNPSTNVIKCFILDAAGFAFLFNSLILFNNLKNRATVSRENRFNRRVKFLFLNVFFEPKNKPRD